MPAYSVTSKDILPKMGWTNNVIGDGDLTVLLPSSVYEIVLITEPLRPIVWGCQIAPPPPQKKKTTKKQQHNLASLGATLVRNSADPLNDPLNCQECRATGVAKKKKRQVELRYLICLVTEPHISMWKLREKHFGWFSVDNKSDLLLKFGEAVFRRGWGWDHTRSPVEPPIKTSLLDKSQTLAHHTHCKVKIHVSPKNLHSVEALG